LNKTDISLHVDFCTKCQIWAQRGSDRPQMRLLESRRFGANLTHLGPKSEIPVIAPKCYRTLRWKNSGFTEKTNRICQANCRITCGNNLCLLVIRHLSYTLLCTDDLSYFVPIWLTLGSNLTILDLCREVQKKRV